jgi:hypothetical protein
VMGCRLQSVLGRNDNAVVVARVQRHPGTYLVCPRADLKAEAAEAA